LRLVWVFASLGLGQFHSHRRGESMRRPQWRLMLATSLAGVRGAITLAGVMTLPLLLPDGTPFPARAGRISRHRGNPIVAGGGEHWSAASVAGTGSARRAISSPGGGPRS